MILWLIVDDVWTGKSMTATASEAKDWHGFVVFALGELPDNVKCMWQMPN